MLFITGDTMLGFKRKSINDIKVGMKVSFGCFEKSRGTIKYVGRVAGSRDRIGVELDPGQGYMIIKMNQ